MRSERGKVGVSGVLFIVILIEYRFYWDSIIPRLSLLRLLCCVQSEVGLRMRLTPNLGDVGGDESAFGDAGGGGN